MSREINLIVIHCSDSPNNKHFTVEDIDDWHQERGFLRNDSYRKNFNPHLGFIGYHYVVYVDGTVVAGRSEDEVGAHAQGYNAKSIGVCMVGRDKFTDAQWKSLNALLTPKLIDYPTARIKGHYQIDTHGKTCPNFDVPAYVSRGMLPDIDDVVYA